MKHIHLFIIGLLACVALLTGCQQSDNLDSQDGLVSSSIQIYRQNDTTRTYRITYNDREVVMSFNPENTVSNSLNFTHLPSDTVGVINIYNGAATTPEFSGTVNVNKQVQFIQMYNDPIMIYNEADITYFYISIVYQATSGNTYTATFNDYPISLDSNIQHMVSRSKLAGTLKLYKNGATTPVYSGNVTMIPEKTFYLVQLPFKEIGPIDNAGEANPSTKNCIKMRFTGLTSATLGADSVRMDIYTAPSSLATSYTSYAFFQSIVVKVGELSPYVEFNLAQYGSTDNSTQALYAAYKLYDAKTGAVISETLSKARMTNTQVFEPSESDPFVSKSKFSTRQIRKGSSSYGTTKLFGTEW
ncbi:MAG: hypothetical protein H6Q67_2068 [Firmicutes bacterium]|nr:hypothetical protein [Bacillota bacterium]